MAGDYNGFVLLQCDTVKVTVYPLGCWPCTQSGHLPLHTTSEVAHLPIHTTSVTSCQTGQWPGSNPGSEIQRERISRAQREIGGKHSHWLNRANWPQPITGFPANIPLFPQCIWIQQNTISSWELDYQHQLYFNFQQNNTYWYPFVHLFIWSPKLFLRSFTVDFWKVLNTSEHLKLALSKSVDVLYGVLVTVTNLDSIRYIPEVDTKSSLSTNNPTSFF